MKKRIHKILGIGISAGLVFGLIGSIFAAPVSANLMEWGKVNTPSQEDNVILPGNDIVDYAVGGDDGSVIYAVTLIQGGCDSINDRFALFKSDDGGVTWSDITDNIKDAASLPDDWTTITWVAVAPDDEDWVVVGGYGSGGTVAENWWVVASQDGGDNFTFTGHIEDDGVGLEEIIDIAVSIEVDDIHNIAVAGIDDGGGSGSGVVFRLKAGTWLSASWVDTRDDTNYPGWEDSIEAVVAVDFSHNFDIDDTIIIMGVNGDLSTGYPGIGVAHLMSGIWETNGAWNDEAGFPAPIAISADGDSLWTGGYYRAMGFALPADYDGSDPGARVVYIYVNAYNVVTELVGGFVMRVDNGSVSEPYGPRGEPLLASIDFHGDADTGKMMLGEFIRVDNDDDSLFGEFGLEEPEECGGVRVWHTVELDPCCPDWELACKSPSGPFFALVSYTPDGAKAYATTSGIAPVDGTYGDFNPDTFWPWGNRGNADDESAFSVSLDDGVSFNQIGLIDTNIHYLADLAVCPDCSVLYLSTVQDEATCTTRWNSYCDSVWRSYDDGETWERVFHGDWWEGDGYGWPLLRLPCDELEECCTVYLGLYDKDQMFYSRDCGQCWNEPPATKIDIQDFAVESENVVYVIDHDGDFSMSTQYGRRWSDPVNTGLDSGHSITACCDEGMVVVGPCSCGSDHGVAWSDDGGDSWNITDDVPDTGEVHVACDPTCENIVYAAVDESSGNGSGIYRTDITDGAWSDLNAIKTDYTGIVVAREGTLYASSDHIEADTSQECEHRFDGSGTPVDYSGAARNLDPCETACCGTEDWDYLICGLEAEQEDFDMPYPNALRICGCLTTETNSVLYAIDDAEYDLTDGSDGSLWSYEDCAAKMGPTLTSPTDGSVLDCEPCAGCDAANFTLKWERMCEACSYDVQIMDEDGNLIVEWVDVDITGDPPTLFVDGTMDDTEYALECGMTYTWHVREANTACECVHSPWSETWSFTIAVGAADAIQLLAPEKGAMGTPIESLGFSWTGVRNADTYSFVLSPNANLTSALVSQEMSTTAFNFAGPLDYGKAYYWQVIAWQDGIRLTTSSIGVFNTMAEPEEAPPPVVVEEQPAPVINIPPAEKITPTWIYVIIGVGCALAVVVIVLIIRTRRP